MGLDGGRKLDVSLVYCCALMISRVWWFYRWVHGFVGRVRARALAVIVFRRSTWFMLCERYREYYKNTDNRGALKMDKLPVSHRENLDMIFSSYRCCCYAQWRSKGVY